MSWPLFSATVPQDWQDLKSLILAELGISLDEAEQFFDPTDPFFLSLTELQIDPQQIEKASQIIKTSQETGQKIVIFGDYDADGVCATSLVWRVLNTLGCTVVPFIPDRHKHGYGLSIKALEEVWSTHSPAVLLTVDNGIVAHDAAEWIKERGCTLIITDHHQPEHVDGVPSWPAHDVIVHTTKLCGATVAWVLMYEVAKYFEQQLHLEDHPENVPPPQINVLELLAEQLDLCGIATITDQMPLLGANRSFAVAGLAALTETTRPGLIALYEQAGWAQAETTTTTINYGIGPRLNAMGRLKNGMDAVRLLCTSSTERAKQLAQVINDTNTDRQQLTAELLALADDQIRQATTNATIEQKLIITAHEEYHLGVIGLIAGKLVETHKKPAIVLNISGDVAKASVRSVPGVNIVELLRMVQDDLLEVGGHPLAAGFSVRTDKIALVSERLQQLAVEYIAEGSVQHLPVVCELPPHLVSLNTAQGIQDFAPFGQGNREPLFLLPSYSIIDKQIFGKDQNHLRLSIIPTQGAELDVSVQPLKVVWWRGVDAVLLGDQLQGTPVVGSRVDLAVRLEVNTWKEKESLQLVVADWHVVG